MDQELKQYLIAMEERLTERINDSETRLLRAFADYHVSWDQRFKRIEVSDATLVERLAALENRVFKLETRTSPEAIRRSLTPTRLIQYFQRRPYAIHWLS